jgi:hypothetical protein
MTPGNKIREDLGDFALTQSFTLQHIPAAAVFKEIEQACQVVSQVFNLLFSKTYSRYDFSFDLVPRKGTGEEHGTRIPSDFFGGLNSLIQGNGNLDKIGDLRISMVKSQHFPDESVAYAYTPGNFPNRIGDIGGDVRFNCEAPWKTEEFNIPDAVSLKYVAIHCILHSLGIGHSVSPTSLMNSVFDSSMSIHEHMPREDINTIHRAYAGTPLVMTLQNQKLFRLDGQTVTSYIPSFKRSWKGKFKTVGISPSGYVYVINTRNEFFCRNNISDESPFGSGFVKIKGHMHTLSAGALLMAVNSKRIPHVRLGVSSSNPAGKSWQKIPDLLIKTIVCSPAARPFHGQISVFGITAKQKVYFRHGVTYDSPLGTKWTKLQGVRMRQIVIGNFGNHVIGLTINFQIVQRMNITSEIPQGTKWKKINQKIQAKCLAVSPTGDLYAIGVNNRLYYNRYMDKNWERIKIGKLNFIAVGFQKS